ncbi:MAG: DUF615 domain-containing protein [Desulfuromonadales bacterium]|nr:DUF615 domain-containing protein [Desulfuromonadales bacterium]NIS43424.1 DUF615 domain-containing protein [Desulfuromonadales bacterium]
MDDQEFADLPPSRTALKKASREIEVLARRLAELSEAERLGLPIDDYLREEIRRAATTSGRGAHKRQIKYLAGVLRKRPEDVEAVQLHLDGLHAEQLQEKESFHRLEDMRDRLCDPQRFEEALVQLRQNCPMIDHRQIGRLARSVHNSGDKKAYREIFRRLREGSE